MDESPWTAELSERARACLRGRRVWFLGNSVARHWAFLLVDLMYNNVTKATRMPSSLRQDQKHRCSAGGVFGGKRADTDENGGSLNKKVLDCFGMCACDFVEVDGLLGVDHSLSFGWTWGIASAKIFDYLASPAGPDVVVYNAGLPGSVCPECKSGESVVDAQSRELRTRLEAVLAKRPKMHFYWRDSTALCQGWTKENPLVMMLNDKIARQIRDLPQVRYLNAFNWTEDRCSEYDDRIHHSVLAFAHVTTWLRQECGLTSLQKQEG